MSILIHIASIATALTLIIGLIFGIREIRYSRRLRLDTVSRTNEEKRHVEIK